MSAEPQRQEEASNADLHRPPDTELLKVHSGGLDVSTLEDLAVSSPGEKSRTLADLPIGAHLILRCRKDWRDATIIAISLEKVTLSVGAPSGRTYRLHRPPGSPLSFDGPIPVLGEGSWRINLARYDIRW